MSSNILFIGIIFICIYDFVSQIKDIYLNEN